MKAPPENSVAESGSALGSAARKYLAAVFGGHSLAETVLLLGMQLFRLIGANCRHLRFLPFVEYLLNSSRPVRRGAVVDSLFPGGLPGRISLPAKVPETMLLYSTVQAHVN